MDKEHGAPQPKAVGSLSRLTILPRASRDNLRIAGSLKSNLPRLSNRYGSSKIVPPVALGENVNRSIADRYAAADQSSKNRNRSPVRDALEVAQAAALETTPPSSGSDIPVFEDHDENPIQSNQPVQKRRPRPSLTERTLETLSQIPASPSPTRRRASVVSNDQKMGPPGWPASDLRGSRPATPSGARASSPSKQPFKPPGRTSPTKEKGTPAVPSPGSLFSPPKAFVRGRSIRPANTTGNDQRSVSSAANPSQASRVPKHYSSKTVRVKPSSHDSAHNALESIFKDPVKPPTSSNGLTVPGSPGSSGLLKPRSIGENVIALSPAKAKSERNKANSSKPVSHSSDTVSAEKPSQTPSLKSSAALRETIAKAKAARKSAASSITPLEDSDREPTIVQGGHFSDDLDIIGSNEGLLKQRIKGATSSGVLNISAMRLTAIPDAVMKMYETNESSVDWSEMRDLTRFNAADNEIETISNDVFPDWSVDQMAEDDEKTNQFGGLEGLDLHNNVLIELPVGLRRLGRLISLNLSGNNLSNNALEIIWQIPGLQDLNLSRNAISGLISLPCKFLRTIRVLKLGENKIQDLRFASSESSLRVLDISNNEIRQPPWEALASLQLIELNISSNAIEGIAFEGILTGFRHLLELDLSKNAFDTLATCVSSFSEIQGCRLNSNRLHELPDISRWRSLITLQVSENCLSELPSGLIELEKVRNVDVSQNSIRIVDPNIARMESLTSLELVGNPLRDRKFLTMDTAEIKLELQKRLTPVDEAAINANGVAATEFTSLKRSQASGSTFIYTSSNGVLDLASKGLTTIDVSQIDLDNTSPSIHTLRLSNNDLTALPHELLSHQALKWSLKSLDISHNPQLHRVDYLTEDLFLPVLQSLCIVSTGLTSLDALTSYLKAPALTELNISCHRLAGHVPWVRAWFPSCTSLLASDNWFSSIDVEAARGLEVLDIRNNYIEELPRKIGLLGNHAGKIEPGRLRVFECGGNRFRVPRITVIEKGSEAVLKDLRRMVPESEVTSEWKDEV